MKRPFYLQQIESNFRVHSVCEILGPRQVGKTTLAKQFKYTDAPRTTKSMHIALVDLKLDKLLLVYPGKDIFPLTEKIAAVGLETIAAGTFHKQVQM